MREYHHVIKIALELLDTIKDGLDQAKNLLLNKRYEDAFVILQDSIEGILTVDEAIKPVLKDLKKEKDVNFLFTELKTSINRLVVDYENKGKNTMAILVSDVHPSFIQWSNKVKQELSPLHSVLNKMNQIK